MREVLERALTLVHRPNAIVMTPAPTDRTPEAQVAHLGALFVWALIREPRRLAGLSYAPLRARDETLTQFPWTPDPALASLSTGELALRAFQDLLIDVHTMLNAEGPGVLEPTSICAAIRERLAIEPKTLAQPYHVSRREARAAFSRDPKQQAGAGLTVLLLTALHTCEIIRMRDRTAIRLMTEEDAKTAKQFNARAANIATLLAAALRAEDGRLVRFEVPCARSADEATMLRGAARAVYQDYSYDAAEGLERLCDGKTFAGAFIGYTRAERLLHEVAR